MLLLTTATPIMQGKYETKWHKSSSVRQSKTVSDSVVVVGLRFRLALSLHASDASPTKFLLQADTAYWLCREADCQPGRQYNNIRSDETWTKHSNEPPVTFPTISTLVTGICKSSLMVKQLPTKEESAHQH